MYFNPRSGERSDVIVPSGSTICWDFNPRSGERSDATEKYQYLEESVFQSTLRRTERPFHGNIALAKNNFNPRSGERSDRLRSCVISSLSISIHAPANGATVNLMVDDWDKRISIHAPANGATSSVNSVSSESGYFNPRSGERSDGQIRNLSCTSLYFNPRSGERSDQALYKNDTAHDISIHAPANGATNVSCVPPVIMSISIHAPANGATVIRVLMQLNAIFQSTLRRTERQACLYTRRIKRIISIHAPANGATLKQ